MNVLVNKPLTEEQVLKKLNINSFREVTKDMTVKLANMIPQMDPEVAKKALEQFPNYADTVTGLVSEYGKKVDRFADSNDSSVKSVYEVINTDIKIIQDQLADPNLTFEQKEILDDKLISIADRALELDKHNKKFILQCIGQVAAVVVCVSVILSNTLSTNSTIYTPDTSDNDSDKKYQA